MAPLARGVSNEAGARQASARFASSPAIPLLRTGIVDPNDLTRWAMGRVVRGGETSRRGQLSWAAPGLDRYGCAPSSRRSCCSCLCSASRSLSQPLLAKWTSRQITMVIESSLPTNVSWVGLGKVTLGPTPPKVRWVLLLSRGTIRWVLDHTRGKIFVSFAKLAAESSASRGMAGGACPWVGF